MTADLLELLAQANDRAPEDRARLIEPIARHGAAAVEQVADWVYDDDLASFAFDIIVEAARQGAVIEARSALTTIRRRQLDLERFAELVRASDLVAALPVEADEGDLEPADDVDALISGRVYRRRALHARGLGGQFYKGISYPAGSGPALLFSGKGGHMFGYRDGWDRGEYRYYGEWGRSDGDMAMTAGNLAIVERSPNLLLFTFMASGLYRFEGRFESAGYSREDLVYEGRTRGAIVFRLRRVADIVPVG